MHAGRRAAILADQEPVCRLSVLVSPADQVLHEAAADWPGVLPQVQCANSHPHLASACACCAYLRMLLSMPMPRTLELSAISALRL